MNGCKCKLWKEAFDNDCIRIVYRSKDNSIAGAGAVAPDNHSVGAFFTYCPFCSLKLTFSRGFAQSKKSKEIKKK